MTKKVKDLLGRYREQILYLLFGMLTTVVDWGICFAGYHLFRVQLEQYWFTVHIVDTVAWLAAVLFAFFTNRIWVFRSNKTGVFPVLGELCLFAGGRFATLLMQEVIMAIFVTALGLNEYAIKLAAAVLVVLLNYVFSKLLVFGRKKK